MLTEVLTLAAVASLAAACLRSGAQAQDLNMSAAVLVGPSARSGPAAQAAPMLLDEVEKRSRIRWSIAKSVPPGAVSAIVIGSSAEIGRRSPSLARALPPTVTGREGYRIASLTVDGRATVVVAGNDARGVLYGVGRLLRLLDMRRDRVSIADGLRIASAPRIALRGHQLGYRPKTNSYDAWTPQMWEQYIRDLVVFGINAVELIPPRSDDAPDSPHFPLPQMDMMVRMSGLLDRYGLDVWIWYPALDPDYAKPETVEFALKEWGDVLDRLPRVDALFVPGGDPGHTRPSVLMAMLAKMAPVLHRRHPKAGIWIAPQGFTTEWLDEFVAILRAQSPNWLAGVVFGPQVRVPLGKLRQMVPARYPIRRYPDITHMRQCQYAMPDWDLAYALTEGREAINPRPVDQAAIFRAVDEHAIGFITYSEGCNDDVNKAVWSSLGWDPDADVKEVLREYARYFIGPSREESFAEGLLALERNWRGPVVANEGIEKTLALFQEMERTATPQEMLNWRFQQALYRAYYDAYVRARAMAEERWEREAMAALRRAPSAGADRAIAEARSALTREPDVSPAPELRARIFELAEALYQSIRMQLSVTRYKAIATERGANLDSVDAPFTNRPWLLRQLDEIRALGSEDEKRQRITGLVGWTDPGPGGFYDEPGNPLRREHLVIGTGFEGDPGCFKSVRVGFSGNPQRLSWTRYAETLYDEPLRMRYTGLDRRGSYRVRVVYGTDGMTRKLRLTAGPGLEVHPWMLKPSPARPLEFDLPQEAYADGKLELTFTAEAGAGGNGRCCQVCEVWILKR